MAMQNGEGEQIKLDKQEQTNLKMYVRYIGGEGFIE
jgi:hypothetical protein